MPSYPLRGWKHSRMQRGNKLVANWITKAHLQVKEIFIVQRTKKKILEQKIPMHNFSPMTGAAKIIRNQSWLRCTLQSISPLNFPPIFQLTSFSAPLAILRRPWPQRLSQRYVAPTLWRNAHTIPVHCLIHGSACAGCWDCTGQVVGRCAQYLAPPLLLPGTLLLC